MKEKLLAFFLVFIIVGLLSMIIVGSKAKKNNSSLGLTLFYSRTCPHCKDVEQWMKNNNIEKKIKIFKKEVGENKDNALELREKAQHCGFSPQNIGVPFLYTKKGECFVGTPDIINYLRLQTGQSSNN